jgi:hypothetical protein
LSTPCVELPRNVWDELWISLGSLLRSYTAVHGLHQAREAAIEVNSCRIFAQFDRRWLALERTGANVTWKCEDGKSGTLQITQAGRLQSDTGEEQELDMAAEAWARELMGSSNDPE